MEMKNLGIAVVAATSCSVFGAEIFEGDGKALSIGGFVDVALGKRGAIYSDPELDVHQISPRINIGGYQEIAPDITVDAKGEWALNYLDGGDTSFTTRLGYIGVTHNQFGRVVMGTQWSPFYSVAGAADMPIAFSNDFLYFDSNSLGTARAEKMVSYQKTFTLNDSLNLDLSTGWQGKEDTNVDSRTQISLNVAYDKFVIGYAYNGGKIAGEDSVLNAVSLKYGEYGIGPYAAIVFTNHDAHDNREYQYYDAILAYGLSNNVNLILNYEEGNDETSNTKMYEHSALQLEYSISSGLMAFIGYQIDLGNDLNENEDDQYSAGLRYFF
ncbi:outer membrane protein N [Vibrio ponticus]|nr:outer membrane protein N [Vibrio ponticus]